MPSEKKSKKHKEEPKAATSAEPLKPLGHYVGDRLELTKQLFSCLKNKQIKNRLPPNLQNKSIERIQQICLDEILGISTKRLLSVINNTRCPDNTDSDDSELEQVEDHVSLEEISSDSEAEAEKGKKTAVVTKVDVAKKPETNSTSVDAKKGKNSKKSPKEMTMLELLELQARARAIRSQLALEPITKIELSDGEAEPKTSKEGKNSTEKKKFSASNQDVGAVKSSDGKQKELPVKRVAPPAPTEKAISAKPVKLKRNYKSQSVVPTNTSKVSLKKEPSPIKEPAEKNNNDDRCSSPDVITMEHSPETFFISDSDDEPPVKKSQEKKDADEKENHKDKSVELGKKSEDIEKEDPPSAAEEQAEQKEDENLQVKSPTNDEAELDDSAINDDVVHLMSDDEIELHHESDKEDEDESEEAPKLSVKSDEPEKKEEKFAAVQSDDDVVEIHNSSDDDMLNESDKSDNVGESSKNTQSWEERWLQSSKTQSILKTTQLASKVRGNMLKTKKTRKESEKKKEETEKAMKQKVSSLEDGSIEQFKVIKEKSNSSVN